MGHLICPKTWDRIVEIFFRHSWSVRGCWGLIWGVYMIIYGINYVLVFIIPEMGMEFGSKKK